MVYIVVLNWNNSRDTIACLKSISFLKNVYFKVIVCDNASTDGSFLNISSWLAENSVSFFGSREAVITEKEIGSYCVPKNKKVILVKNMENKGYAGGNNIGIKLSLQQLDMKYVWVLNNDTEVEPNALYHLLKKCCADKTIGICGSKLVYFHDNEKMQGLGGCYNPWLCKTRNHHWLEPSSIQYDDKKIESEIDYIVGASIFLSRVFVEKVGVFCEDYFLYYEEIDICLRGKKYFKLGVSTDSIVYHKEGASTEGGKSLVADYCSVKNRLLVTKKFHPLKLPIVWLSLFGVLFNRVIRKEYHKAWVVIKIIFSGR